MKKKKKTNSYWWEAIILTYGLWLMMRGTIKIVSYDASLFFRVIFIIFFLVFILFIEGILTRVEDNAVRRIRNE